MGRIGLMEILVVTVAVLLLFGVKDLPKIGRAVGQMFKEFKHSMKDHPDDSSSGDPS